MAGREPPLTRPAAGALVSGTQVAGGMQAADQEKQRINSWDEN